MKHYKVILASLVGVGSLAVLVYAGLNDITLGAELYTTLGGAVGGVMGWLMKSPLK